MAVRVLHVNKAYPPYIGGIEAYLKTLCEGLDSRVDVAVLAASGDRRHSLDIVEGVPVSRVPTLLRVGNAPITMGMARAIKQADVDVFHLHLPNPSGVLSYLASGRDEPLVVSYHADITRQRLLGALLTPMHRQLLDRSAAIVASSPAYVDSSKVLRSYADRCTVIPYGIELEPFDHAHNEEVEQLRARYGPRLVLSVGRIVPYKGFEYLIDAMASVDGHLLIVGQGPLRPTLEAQVQRLGLEKRVTFLRVGEASGTGDALVAYYQAADVFVLPSVTRSEAFGLVQLEAMACRTPVVNTSLNSGAPFVSLHGVSGLTVPPRDSAALADAISQLLDDPGLRARFGAGGRQRVEDEFTVRTMVDRTVAVYEAVHAGSSKGRAAGSNEPSGST